MNFVKITVVFLFGLLFGLIIGAFLGAARPIPY